MKEMDSKSKRKTKHSCRDVILVFAVLMITGVLLAVTASAQFDQQSPGALGQGDLFAPDNTGGASSNQQPMLTALVSDKSSPQEAGLSIKWTANAEDPENDPLSFIFKLKGPSTGDVWKPVNSDPSDNTWKWDTNPEDAGNYQISVSVRDEMHAGPQFTPDERISDFSLTAPPVPEEAPVQPAPEPLPDVAAQQTYQPPAQEQQTAGQEPVAQPQETVPANQPPIMIDPAGVRAVQLRTGRRAGAGYPAGAAAGARLHLPLHGFQGGLPAAFRREQGDVLPDHRLGGTRQGQPGRHDGTRRQRAAQDGIG